MMYAELMGNHKKNRIKSLFDNKKVVEFGTGIIGKGTHPDPNGYQYDVNNHGNAGWGFIDEDGNFHWTKGMQAHRYLFDAVQDYTVGEAYKKIYLECFNEVMGGIFR